MEMTPEDNCTYNAFLNDGLIQEVPSINPAPPALEPTTLTEPSAVEVKPAVYVGTGEDGMKKDFEYPLREDGRINWDDLVNAKYLIYPDNNPTKSPMVKVDGLLDVAELRGVLAKEVNYTAVSETLVVCKVKMVFTPNKDDPHGRMWESVADATPYNINGRLFGKFLTACAETRAVGRCIKQALGIRMVVQEEVTDQSFSQQEDSSPVSHEVVAAIKKQLELKGGTVETLLADIQAKHPEIKSLTDMTSEQGAKMLGFLNAKQNIKS